jgi:murein DD-endopeptidase MepM/ murein hydrolase activator NlpD
MRLPRIQWLVIFALTSLASCEGSTGTGPIEVASVQVTAPADTLTVGRTVQLSASALDASGKALAGRPMQWTTGNGAVATVSNTGVVTAISAGAVTITVSSEGKTAGITLSVRPVAGISVTISADTSALQVGSTRQLSATIRDRFGNVVTGRTITWSSSESRLAQVSATGLVSAFNPGSVRVTAEVNGERGSVQLTIPAHLPLLDRPFADDFRTGNFFDHDLPFPFRDGDRIQLTWWGESILAGYDGHRGYDHILPEGTSLLAAAAGEVTFAGTEQPFHCSFLNRSVAGQWVQIEHRLPNGQRVLSSYGHLSRIDVAKGQRVTAGQVIGLSGNTGCSSEPHLHFEVFRNSAPGGPMFTTDPYGWAGETRDPWAEHAEGGVSVQLWKTGRAPQLYNEVRLAPNPNSTDRAPVAVTSVRWVGVRDGSNPNNEFVELTADSRYSGASVDLTGFALRNNGGDTFRFPSGFRLRAGGSVRVYSGRGTDSESALYWGRTAGVWNNRGDCARLVYPNGAQYRLNSGGGCG